MTEHASAPTVPQSATILVVEDDPDVQRLLQDLLVTAQYQVVVAGSGAQALEAINQEPIDLVLLDVMLPDMDGYTVCQQIREGSMSSLPIIMLTAVSQPQSIVRGLTDADDYLTKPFIPEELIVRIQKILRRRQAALNLTNENTGLRNMLQLVQRELESAHVATQTETLLSQKLFHNVTTHLQSLVAIVEAELRKLPPGLEREAVQRIRSRVRGAALVYQVSELLQTDPVQIDEMIRATASALKSIYRPWKRIVLNLKGEPLGVPATIAAPMAMIVNELVTNCFKHAFPENRFGAIDITYGIVAGNLFSLEIADDGVGFAADKQQMGGGQTTVAQLVQGLNGVINWQSSNTGTRVTITIPLMDAKAATA